MSYIEENGCFIFDGIKSSDYGVWITGSGTFNAPARRYKEYVVPGRNGVLTVDDGSFEEAEVVYPAFIARDFHSRIEDFRNQLMSRNGYVRMTDSYHPDEYYLAKYAEGIEVDVAPGGVGGSFDLTFKRDPRRFLKSGENVVIYPPGQKSKNMLPYPYYSGSGTISGITYAVNADGSISVQCSPSTSYNVFVLKKEFVSAFGLRVGDEITFSCGIVPTNQVYMEIYPVNPPGTITKLAENETITITERMLETDMTVAFYIGNGQTLNTTIYPMIRWASDTDPTWERYNPNADEIVNPTLFQSKPIIKVTPTDNNYNPDFDNVITIGDQQITLHHIAPYVIINSEIEDCYCGTANLNSQVTFSNGKFPALLPGANAVSKPLTIKSVEITPNWYRL